MSTNAAEDTRAPESPSTCAETYLTASTKRPLSDLMPSFLTISRPHRGLEPDPTEM